MDFQSGKYYLFLVFIFIAPISVEAQMNYNFQRMDLSDGLSHNYVYALFQDSKNYVWIGTAAGLHRFDGRDFVDYKNVYGNRESLGSGYVRAIFESSAGEIWVGTEGGGISVLKNGKFLNYLSSDSIGPNNDVVEQIVEMPDGSLYFASWGGGINVYKDGKFSYINASNSALTSDDIVDLFYDPETEILWIGSWGGGLFQMKDNEITKVSKGPDQFNSDIARTIAKTEDGSIWIGTWGDGLFRFFEGKYEHYSFDLGNANRVDNNKLLTLAADGNKLWIGSYGGGVHLFENGNFTTYTNNPDNKNSISSNFIECSIVDHAGSLWVGTYGGGITKFQRSYFESYQHLPEKRSSLPHNFVRSISQFDEQSMLVATRGSGLDIFDGQSFTPMNTKYGSQFKFKTVTALLKARNNDFWIAGPLGVGLWVFKNGELEDHTTKYGIDLSKYNFYQIIEDYDGSIWLANEFGGGLNQIVGDSLVRYRHDPEDEYSVGHNEVMCLHQSKDSTLWIGLRRYGLNSYKNGKFTRYRSNPADSTTLSNDFVFMIHETADGYIWVVTEKGLSRLDPNTGLFKRYFSTDGLGNDMVVSILEDGHGNLWLGTHRGITRFDPKSETFWNFDYKHGINTHPLNYNTAAVNQNTGEMYFGGVNGLLKFHPDSIKPDNSVPNIQITNLKVNNEIVKISADGLLKKPIEETTTIRLDHDERIVSFTVSAMDFVLSNENQFEYYIEGHHFGWQKNGTKREIPLPDLSPGTYYFKVRSSIDGISWSDPKSIEIKIVRAWWETYWFRIIAALMFLGLLVLAFRWRLDYLENQRNKLKKLVNKKTTEIQLSNQELKNALHQLEDTQEKLIKSEKLAALSQVVFNLLHELNSPLGSTKSGLDFIRKDVLLEIEMLPKIIDSLDEKEFRVFKSFIEEVLSEEIYYSPEEVRKMREALKISLTKMNITSEKIFDSLVAIDCFHISELTKELLSFDHAEELFEVAETIILKYHNLRNMDRSVERSINILNSLKTYTNPDKESTYQPIDLIKNIEHAIKLQEHFFKNGVKLIRSYSISPIVLGNEEQLNQVWLNLISNANYAMNYKGMLNIMINKQKEKVIISIQDDGAGIPEEVQQKIFEPFFTTKPLGEGRGIGLDIVQKILNDHHGDIKFTSQPGRTVFTVCLPIQSNSSTPSANSDASKATSQAEKPKSADFWVGE